LKPDKGNALVIIDKDDLEERMNIVIQNGDYEEIVDGRLVNNNPVNVMQTNVKNFLKEQVEHKGINASIARKLILPNPTVPSLYGAPKIHKPGKKMRQIVSYVNSPLYELAKYTAKQLEELQIDMGFEIKNSLEFIERVKDLKIGEDEILVSFDVESLFPSVPLEPTLNTVKHHINRQNINKEKKNFLIKSIELCTSLNQFQYRGKFYKQMSGLPMGSSLSPKLASFFMLHLENKVKRQKWFPRVYIRYVDDIFAVVKKNDVEKIRENLSSQFDSINFTVEMEDNNQIPFLDILVKREEENLSFSIYRKPTSTQLFIQNESNHSKQHKMAAFNSMFNRLLSIPMKTEDFEKEKEYIFQTGKINGYSKTQLDKLLRKHVRKREIQNLTSLEIIEQDAPKFISLPFVPPLTYKLDNELRKYGFKVAYNNNGKLRDLLGTAKDKVTEDEEKSGIYEIKCSSCDATYIGQTKRKLKTRYKEHLEDVKKTVNDEKPLAKHAIEENHPIGQMKLLKEVKKPHKLDAYESLYLFKNKDKNLLNCQTEGNNPSILFKFTKS
jgi:hypothetical protein